MPIYRIVREECRGMVHTNVYYLSQRTQIVHVHRFNSKRGSFDDRDREGLQLLSPTLQRRVLKLQRDLEEAKAESRYFRVKRAENRAVAPNRPRFTSTPVPRYAGGSNWDQYRDVFEAIVCSNGWDEVTAALQLIAHLDGEALNVALLVPEAQRIRPGVLLKTLSAHYASPGRLASTNASSKE